jgi:cell wall-associated NlpC family hydrolase
VRALRLYAHRSALRETARINLRKARIELRARIAAAHAATSRRLEKARRAHTVLRRSTTAGRRESVRIHRSTRQFRVRGRQTPRMAAVIAYARSQVGKSYSSGAEGPHSFDCSGLTKRAYAHAGLHLPHSSGAQAAHARPVSRSSARPGDLVVGRGHVGIYMGGGMMIDAGNPRTGVVYRPLYNGLRIERF